MQHAYLIFSLSFHLLLWCQKRNQPVAKHSLPFPASFSHSVQFYPACQPLSICMPISLSYLPPFVRGQQSWLFSASDWHDQRLSGWCQKLCRFSKKWTNYPLRRTISIIICKQRKPNVYHHLSCHQLPASPRSTVSPLCYYTAFCLSLQYSLQIFSEKICFFRDFLPSTPKTIFFFCSLRRCHTQWFSNNNQNRWLCCSFFNREPISPAITEAITYYQLLFAGCNRNDNRDSSNR